MNSKLLLGIGVVAVGLLLLRYYRSTSSVGDELGKSEVVVEIGAEQRRLENLPNSAIAKISVNQRGEVTLNGKAASLNELDNELNRLKEIDGVVWYHRNLPEDGATDAVMAVFTRIVNVRLPMMLFTDAEFKNPLP